MCVYRGPGTCVRVRVRLALRLNEVAWCMGVNLLSELSLCASICVH